MTWTEPSPDEVRPSGEAVYISNNGIAFRVPSCEPCARVAGVGWQEALFEGVCQGCEVRLSGLA